MAPSPCKDGWPISSSHLSNNLIPHWQWRPVRVDNRWKKMYQVQYWSNLHLHSRSETFGPLVGNSHRAVVWCPMGIPRHSFLMWLVVLDRCPTKDRLLRWGLPGVNPIGLLCNSQPESRDHLFFQCCYSETAWRTITLRCQFQSPAGWEQN